MVVFPNSPPDEVKTAHVKWVFDISTTQTTEWTQFHIAHNTNRECLVQCAKVTEQLLEGYKQNCYAITFRI